MVELAPTVGRHGAMTDGATRKADNMAPQQRGYAESVRRSIELAEFTKDARALDSRHIYYKAIKRGFDLFVSTFVIIVGIIPGLLLALFVWLSTGGFPIYSQIRVGLYGKRFNIYKFRTMVADSDNVEKYFTSEQLQVWKQERKVNDDPRITGLGKFLRATSVDELPNFLNVFLGQMSTVGPRAIAVDELQWFGGYAPELLSVTPGITGWWQVTDRNKATYRTGARQRRELHYVRNASIWLDCVIIARTVKTVVCRTGQ